MVIFKFTLMPAEAAAILDYEFFLVAIVVVMVVFDSIIIKVTYKQFTVLHLLGKVVLF